MLIAIAVPAVLFLIGLGFMMRNEEKCMQRNESAAIYSKKRR